MFSFSTGSVLPEKTSFFKYPVLQFDLVIFVDLNQPDSDADPLKKGLALTVHFRGKFINYVRFLPVLSIVNIPFGTVDP